MNINDVEIYSPGIVCCSVCVPASMPKETIEKYVNIINATGINSPWKISETTHFKQGQTNPCPCNTNPGRLHYLLNC